MWKFVALVASEGRKSIPGGTKIDPLELQNRAKIDLGTPRSAQESSREPKSAPRATQERPGGAQERPKRAKRSPGRLEKTPRERQNRSKVGSEPCRQPTSDEKRVRQHFRDDFRSILRSKTLCSLSANFAQKSRRKQLCQLCRKCVSYRKIQCPRPIRA